MTMTITETWLDTVVRCEKCQREQHVRFAICLHGGWPRCHGYTMTMVRTTADIEVAVHSLLDSAVEAARVAALPAQRLAPGLGTGAALTLPAVPAAGTRREPVAVPRPRDRAGTTGWS